MKRLGIGLTALAGMGLALATPAFAEEELDYKDALQCSAFYTFLGAITTGVPEKEGFKDIASRWLLIAMVRDGSDEGDTAIAEFDPMVEDLIGVLEGMGEDEAAIEAFLFQRVEFCDAAQATVAEEFDSIK